VRDYLFIDDAVRGLTLVATAGASGEEYNVASGQPMRLMDLALLIAELMGCPDIRIATGRSFAGDTARWYADISKVRSGSSRASTSGLASSEPSRGWRRGR
jgi:UDP-glucose 4-epimerase